MPQLDAGFITHSGPDPLLQVVLDELQLPPSALIALTGSNATTSATTLSRPCGDAHAHVPAPAGRRSHRRALGATQRHTGSAATQWRALLVKRRGCGGMSAQAHLASTFRSPVWGSSPHEPDQKGGDSTQTGSAHPMAVSAAEATATGGASKSVRRLHVVACRARRCADAEAAASAGAD